MPAERQIVLDLATFRYNPGKVAKAVGNTSTAAVVTKGREPKDLSVCDVYYPATPSTREGYRTKAGKRVTAHQWAVYDLVRTIPAGQVATYKDVCAALGSGSPRSVGGALRNNPFAPYVPCHRIIASNLFIGGFFGEWTNLKNQPTAVDESQEVTENWHESFKGKGSGVIQREKIRMLAMEGVMFSNDGKLQGGEGFLWRAGEQ
ncbi:DNA binding methylated-DNA--cysteine S-methyltransferase [Artomyces pyxidatus]|uniref:DNA binding methylated-DNA--cysteine S-methyltransferase n=1 Tax=Artomyces pyxidatus TaxID=48021 RepID=A0ACB8ST92_9AGAM|nr:DNA binding methylated-DNA--cysteine S-methyltransferase [Artomyces pyxidatus]